jgi:hypothetical protein
MGIKMHVRRQLIDASEFENEAVLCPVGHHCIRESERNGLLHPHGYGRLEIESSLAPRAWKIEVIQVVIMFRCYNYRDCCL